MKNFRFKNCIAFTLTEMTIVLLIMSVLAAAATPIITKSISDSNEKIYQAATVPPWAPLKDVGGIYYKPSNPSGVVSIGLMPTNANLVYNNPALSIFSYGTYASITKFPQIVSLYNIDGVNRIKNKAIISMDPFSNLAIATNSFDNAYSRGSLEIAYHGNTYIGSLLLPESLKNAFNRRVVMIGNDIQTYSSSASVYIGRNLKQSGYDYNSIVIGYGIHGVGEPVTNIGSVIMGSRAGNESNGAYNVKLGHYAGASEVKIYQNKDSNSLIKATENWSVSIGSYAGVSATTYASNLVSIGAMSGQYANNGDVSIGYLAGTSKYMVNNHSDNISIGTSAGLRDGLVPNQFIVAIGDTAGAYGSTLSRSIAIGSQAGMYSSGLSNILIGSRAYAGNGNSAIRIGGNAGYNVSGSSSGYYNNSIDIGYMAGAESNTHKYNIFIGNYAGVGSNTDGRNYSVALGYASCEHTSTTSRYTLRKMCIGAGPVPYDNVLNTKAWDSGSSKTVIGNRYFSPYSNYITLYAGTVYAPSATPNVLSDKRLKENIVASKHSLDDVRKVNIYTYNFKGDKDKKIGVIAQEYKKIFPNGVIIEPETKILAVNSDWLVYSAVNAVKELDKSIQQLEIDLKAYIKDFLGLKSRVAKLEKQASQLRQQNSMIKARLEKLK